MVEGGDGYTHSLGTGWSIMSSILPFGGGKFFCKNASLSSFGLKIVGKLRPDTNYLLFDRAVDINNWDKCGVSVVCCFIREVVHVRVTTLLLLLWLTIQWPLLFCLEKGTGIHGCIVIETGIFPHR